MAQTAKLLFTLAAALIVSPVLAQNRDSVIICQTLEPPILDPTGGAAAAIREITYDNIFENLIAITGDGSRVPRLAESWTSSADGMVHTFKLRAGVTFHDGTPMTSADVKFSFERGQAPDAKHSQKWIFAPIGSIATPDPLTVVITLKEFVGDFIESLALSDAAIVSPQSIAKAATEPVGTGPYQFVRWQRGDRVVMKRNESYWGKKPAIANATFRFVTDPQAQVAALLAGDCDAHTNIGAPEAVDQLKRDAKLRVTIGRTEGETIMAMNATKPPFNDVRVRKAVSMAIDRALVNEGAMSGFGALIGSHFSPNHPAYLDLTREVKVDAKAAKALLAEAGFPNGFSVSMRQAKSSRRCSRRLASRRPSSRWNGRNGWSACSATRIMISRLSRMSSPVISTSMRATATISASLRRR
jgi:peptide/nickel transport system substrate-binding protein